MTTRLVGLLVFLEEDAQADDALDGVTATLHHLKGIAAVEFMDASTLEALSARALNLRIRHRVTVEDVHPRCDAPAHDRRAGFRLTRLSNP